MLSIFQEYKVTPFLNKLRGFKEAVLDNLEDFLRYQKKPLDLIVNQKEIRVVGLQRSGNHAIINWIWKQQGEQVMHLNNIPVKCNPYRFLYRHYSKERLRLEAKGQFILKDLLIYSYEDCRLDDIVDKSFEKKHDIYLGKSLKRYDGLILRDPFNCFASRLKMYENSTHPRKEKLISQESVQLWIAYAKEFLGETNYLQHNKICFNYNLWTTDVEYRKQLAEKLELVFTDAEFERVKGQGGGSSFDGTSMKYQGSNMKVNERWKIYANNPLYLKIVSNPELLKYHQKIFGDIPGLKQEEISKIFS